MEIVNIAREDLCQSFSHSDVISPEIRLWLALNIELRARLIL